MDLSELNAWSKAIANNTARGLLSAQGQIVADNFRIDIRTSKNDKPDYTIYAIAGLVTVATFAAMVYSKRN